MGSEKRPSHTCPHLAAVGGKQTQLHRSLLLHFQARKAAGEPLLPLGEGLLCLGCGAAWATPEQHPQTVSGGAKKQACSGRDVMLDLRTGELRCSACCDYIFDRDFDLALQTALAATKAGKGSSGGGGSVAMGADVAGPPAAAFYQQCSDQQTAAGGDPTAAGASSQQQQQQQQGLPPDALRALAEGFAAVGADGFPSGLRGLNNMGNTCFMNSVLQALLHAPLLRNHYLLNRHSKAGCAITADGGCCVNCELDGVFSAAYSGRRAGYSPSQFLYTWWMLAGGQLSGYQQQDAHEFFCFILEMMASTAGADNITQRVFGGTLRSDLICSACGHVSTSHEQFSHLSLDIPPPQQLIAPTILPRPTGGHGGGGGGGSSQPHAAAAAQAAPAAAGGGGHGSQAGGAIKAKSHKKGASSSGRAATNQSGGASKGSRLVGAAKLSHERALARKAAETAAAAAAAAMEAAAAPVAGSGGSDSPVELFNTQHSNVQQWQSQGQQQLGGLEGPQPLGQGGDSSSEVEIIDMCASDSMSLGGSLGNGLLGQGGLEAASGVHQHGPALLGDDDAQDTLSSPRQQLLGALPHQLQRAASGTAGAPGLWQQGAVAGRQPQGAAGRPPIPPGSRSGRGAAGPTAALAAAGESGGRKAAGSGSNGSRQQAEAAEGSGSPDLDSMLLDGSGSYPTAAEAGAAAAVAAPGVLEQQQRHQQPQGKQQQQAQQDALAAATNLPGSQDLAPGAEAAAVAALPPQLAGYYRWPGASLLGCLNRFTHAEQLGRGERWTCERCCSGQHAVKQLSLRHLPPLLVFHAKRFEHAGGLRAVAKKLDTYLSFPLRDLDMRAYLSSAVLRSRFRLPPPPPQQQFDAAGGEGGIRRTRNGAALGSRRNSGSLGSPRGHSPTSGSAQQQPASPPFSPTLAAAGAAPGAGPSPAATAAAGAAGGAALAGDDFLYDLYAVVCHKGSFQGGHYVAYVKAADRRWYLCDDAWVTASDEEAVRNCQAYLLFYSQRRLLEQH